MTVDHPQFGTMCAICFEGLTPDRCAEDTDGQKWDLCKRECARQAGVQEKSDTDTTPGRHLMTTLSQRQLEVLAYVAEGCDNNAIARQLQVSVNTVKTHLRLISKRLGTSGRAHAVAEAMRRGELK